MHAIETDATLKLAKSKLRSGQIPGAEAMYKQVLAGDPACAEAVHFLGIVAMHTGKMEEAFKLIRQSIELEPQQSDYFNNMATVLGRMNKAIEAIRLP
jgi:Flp pilus assembly protein TadD